MRREPGAMIMLAYLTAAVLAVVGAVTGTWLMTRTSELRAAGMSEPPSPAPHSTGTRPALAPAPLRCHREAGFDVATGAPVAIERVMTREELEAELLIAQKARDTAMSQIWNVQADRWIRIADVTLRLVELCRAQEESAP